MCTICSSGTHYFISSLRVSLSELCSPSLQSYLDLSVFICSTSRRKHFVWALLYVQLRGPQRVTSDPQCLWWLTVFTTVQQSSLCTQQSEAGPSAPTTPAHQSLSATVFLEECLPDPATTQHNHDAHNLQTILTAVSAAWTLPSNIIQSQADRTF